MDRFSRRAALGLVASALAVGVAVRAASAQEIIERIMPELKVEVVPAAPDAGWSWVPGHWVWAPNFHRWAWMRGHYVHMVVPPMPALIVETQPLLPGPGWYWVRGHWAWEGGRWFWHPGRWYR